MRRVEFSAPTLVSSAAVLRDLFGPERPSLDEGATVLFEGPVSVAGGVCFRGENVLAADTSVDVGSVLANAKIGRQTRIRPYSLINDTTVGTEGILGPFCFLRDGCIIGNCCIVGAHVEVARSRLGDGVKISHQAFIGDAEIADEVIIGAGVVFCNYDKGARQVSVIGRESMIGSGTMLVAPLSIGCHVTVGAGSVVTRSLADGACFIQRRTKP